RLRQELIRRLRSRDMPHELWIGRGDPLSAGARFGLLGGAIQDALGIRAPDSAESRRERIAAATAGLKAAGRVASFLGELLGASSSGEGDPQLQAARREPLLMGDQIRWAAEDFLRARCEERLVVFVLEDLQWGDLPTVTFVDAALRTLSALPFFVI